MAGLVLLSKHRFEVVLLQVFAKLWDGKFLHVECLKTVRFAGDV
jgi:hypothetical protein